MRVRCQDERMKNKADAAAQDRESAQLAQADELKWEYEVWTQMKTQHEF